jgi:hypothetical protein
MSDEQYIPKVNANRPRTSKRRHSFTRVLREIGETRRPGATRTRKEELAEMVWNMALNEENFAVIKWIYTRCDGRPHQAIELSGPDGKPIAHSIFNAPRDMTIEEWESQYDKSGSVAISRFNAEVAEQESDDDSDDDSDDEVDDGDND